MRKRLLMAAAVVATLAGLVVAFVHPALTWSSEPATGESWRITLAVILVWLTCGAGTTATIAWWHDREGD